MHLKTLSESIYLGFPRKKLVAGFPLTHAEVSKSFAVTSGHQPEDTDWSAFSKIDTLVVLMVGRKLAALMGLLEMEGWDPAMPVSEPIHHPFACTLPSAQSPLSAMLRGLISACSLNGILPSIPPSLAPLLALPIPIFSTPFPSRGIRSHGRDGTPQPLELS